MIKAHFKHQRNIYFYKIVKNKLGHFHKNWIQNKTHHKPF